MSEILRAKRREDKQKRKEKRHVLARVEVWLLGRGRHILARVGVGGLDRFARVWLLGCGC